MVRRIDSYVSWQIMQGLKPRCLTREIQLHAHSFEAANGLTLLQ